MPIKPAPVTGSDGHAPMYSPDGRWTIYNLNEIYRGNDGNKKYVPNVGDWVQDTDNNIVYKVTYVDSMTLIPTLVEVNASSSTQDLLVGPTADSYRVYIDTSVTPHILAVDTRLKVSGTMSDHAKIFKGGDISTTGRQISFLYDSQGRYLTDKINLELAAIDTHTNHTIKTVGIAHTKENLKDGERVVLVIYNDQGHVVATQSLVVENTSFIRHISAGTKYISHISVDSPFVSSSNANTLEYPINIPVQAFNLHGVLHYSDGSERKLPVDGSKFRMLGLEHFVSTVIGQELKLVLSYKLDPNEATYAAVSGDGKFITQALSLVTTRQDGAYTVKVFGYPHWVDEATGYQMQYYLMDLNRDVLFNVTPFIYYNRNSDVFDPKGYGRVQRLSFRLNLKDVSSALKAYIHTQTLDVVLREKGDSATTRWSIGFDPTQSPYYGENLFCLAKEVSPGVWKVKLKNNKVNKTEWLKAMYYDAKPITDKKLEVTPPEPTHMVLTIGSVKQEYPITLWDTPMNVTAALELNSEVYIEWIRKTSTSTLRLAYTALSVKEDV